MIIRCLKKYLFSWKNTLIVRNPSTPLLPGYKLSNGDVLINEQKKQLLHIKYKGKQFMRSKFKFKYFLLEEETIQKNMKVQKPVNP